MQTYEYKVKVTTQKSFSEEAIGKWLTDLSARRWRLITSTYFGGGILWVFGRELVFDAPQDPENLDENSPS